MGNPSSVDDLRGTAANALAATKPSAGRRQSLRLWLPYLCLVPAVIASCGVLLYPTLRMFQYSFLNWSFGKGYETAEWDGLANYQWLITSQSSTLFHSLRLTLLYAGTSIVCELVLGLAIAVLLNRRHVFGRQIVLTGFMIPTLLMPVMVGMMWRMYMYPNGMLSYFLGLVGIRIDWYTATWAMPAVILIEIWQFTPFFVISLFAGLRAISAEILEAAAIDGASGWNRFWHISLPYLRPIIVVTSMIRVLWILKSFDIVYTMFTGGPGSATEILGIGIYRALFLSRNIGRSAALSVILAALTLLVTFAFVRFAYRSREVMERAAS
jgi:multiple sugar transport system permease protein